MKKRLRVGASMILAMFVLSGCAQHEMKYDYTAYQTHPPTSILVLPPINHSVDVKARDEYLSTVTRPLAEAGYYVFPVWLVDKYLRSNGETGGAQIGSIPLSKLRSAFHPDAVLYTTINHWGQKYHVIESDTVADLSCRLVDASTGTLLWRGHINYVLSNNQGATSSPLAMLIGAALAQIIGSGPSHARLASSNALGLMLNNPNTGLPFGPYNPHADSDTRR